MIISRYFPIRHIFEECMHICLDKYSAANDEYTNSHGNGEKCKKKCFSIGICTPNSHYLVSADLQICAFRHALPYDNMRVRERKTNT